MIKFDDLSPKEQSERRAALERDLELNPSTPEQSMYFRFTSANKGFEWVDRITGKTYTKLDMWVKFYGNEVELTRITEEMNPRYIKRLKIGWIRHKSEFSDEEIVMRVEEVVDFKRKERKRIEKLEKLKKQTAEKTA